MYTGPSALRAASAIPTTEMLSEGTATLIPGIALMRARSSVMVLEAPSSPQERPPSGTAILTGSEGMDKDSLI